MKRLKMLKRSTVPPELHANACHSLCCNGRTRQRFTSALCGGRYPVHGRLLAAPLRGSPLCAMETGHQFVRIIAFVRMKLR